jgi:predicted SprT family Zn-dependent metalloprotease
MIPKYFYIFGEKVKVSQVNKVDKGKRFGECDYDKNLIRLAKTEVKQDQKEQTYYHELVHMMLHHLSYDKLKDDEEFVDRMGKVLHQVMKTSQY